MFTTLVAVVAALVLGHVAPAPVASLRRFHWWARWLDWIGTHAGEGGFWQGRSGLWLALLPPVLLVLLLQVLLHDRLWGLLGLLFGVVVLVCVWGPRDLDIDVEAARLPEENAAGARVLLQWLEWPVAQLMALALALAGNFDLVFRAWRSAGGDRWQVQSGFLEAAGRAAVRGELAEEAEDYLREGQPVPFAGDLVELRDAMSLVWRMLLVWLAVLALLVIAGWVS